MIPIQLDDNTKTRIIHRHWLWFWMRLNNKKINLHDGQQTLFQFFNSQLHWSKKDFKKLILGEYNNLLKYTKPSSKYCREFKSIAAKGITRRTTKTFGEIMEEVMGYNDFRCGNNFKYTCFNKNRMEYINNWNANVLVRELKLKVCPYCNKEDISASNDNITYIGEIDHFFPEAIYPYLSCSLFNFIPSCHSCNKNKTIAYNTYNAGQISLTIYPYKNGFEQELKNGKIKKYAAFKLIPGPNPNDIFNPNGIKLEYVNHKLKSKIINSNKAFHIEKRYNACETELNNLLGNYKKYVDAKKEDIIKIFNPNIYAYINTPGLSRQVVQKIKAASLRDSKIHLRNKIINIPTDKNGQPVKEEYRLRKFKNDIIEHLNALVRKKKKHQKKANI